MHTLHWVRVAQDRLQATDRFILQSLASGPNRGNSRSEEHSREAAALCIFKLAEAEMLNLV